MICPGFLDPASRKDPIALTRDGSAAHQLGRRANALVPLDDGMRCEAIARVLFLDGDTIRTTFRDFSAAMLTFLCKDGPGNWSTFCEEVTDNFRVINPTRYRVIV